MNIFDTKISRKDFAKRKIYGIKLIPLLSEEHSCLDEFIAYQDSRTYRKAILRTHDAKANC